MPGKSTTERIEDNPKNDVREAPDPEAGREFRAMAGDQFRGGQAGLSDARRYQPRRGGKTLGPDRSTLEVDRRERRTSRLAIPKCRVRMGSSLG